MSNPVSLFYSYASRDETLRRRLEVHLSLLKREALLETWSFRQIGGGQEWKGAIDSKLNAAAVILLLVSADFIASDYCWDIEMNRALERHAAGSAIVVPVILKPCDWSTAPFAKLQALPDAGKPVTEWRSRDKAWLGVVGGLRRILQTRVPTETKEVSASPHSVPNINLAEANVIHGVADVVTINTFVPSARDRVDAAPFFELVGASFSNGTLDFQVRNLGAPIVCQDFVAISPGLHINDWSPGALGTNQIFRSPTAITAQYPGRYVFRMTFRDRWQYLRVFELRLDSVSFPAKLDFIELERE